ncbi:MAG: hypothetical protein QOF95_1232 [Pseudonocardiales bacterium]|nr:hypothetical protein [Pseudonocardiales bacterium]
MSSVLSPDGHPATRAAPKGTALVLGQATQHAKRDRAGDRPFEAVGEDGAGAADTLRVLSVCMTRSDGAHREEELGVVA